MANQTTGIELSTTPVALISNTTTWANINRATIHDKVPFFVLNPLAQTVYIGSSSITSAAPTVGGIALLQNQSFSANLNQGDAFFGVTSASTVTVSVLAGRQ